MIKPSIVKCNICEEKILLRFQLGYYNIPFVFNCPNCGISIGGIQIVSNGQLEINNAIEIEENLENVGYYGNFSVEFLNKKLSKFISIDDIISQDFSPFMRTAMLFGDNLEFSKTNDRICNFLNFKNEKWNGIYSLFELYLNDKLEYLKKEITKYSNGYNIINELDACVALHQLLLVGFNSILPDDSLKNYTNISKKIFDKNRFKEMQEFINYVKNKVDFKSLNFKIIDLYNRWIKDYEKYMAVVTLCISDKLDKVDKENFILSTIDFESMKSFYSDSYELILDLIWIPVGLNNIHVRGSYNLFSDECDIENFDKYFLIKTKLNKSKALKDNEIFSIYLGMDRKVRNSISHFDYELHKNSPKVIFHDNGNDVELYLVDFAKLCYENVILITYLNELYYSLMKYDYINMGLNLNIINEISGDN